MKRTVWLVRHGHRLDFASPEWFENAARRYDPPLSAEGLEQVQKLSQRLAPEKIDHIFCSPFLRAVQTAYPLADSLNLSIKVEAGLGEWLNPHWITERPETEPWESLCRQYPLIEPHYCSCVIPSYPETETAMMTRLAVVTEQLTTKFSGNLLFVGHMATVAEVATSLLGRNAIAKVPVASITQLVQTQQRWQLRLNADISHY